jgi:hypothetical protein
MKRKMTTEDNEKKPDPRVGFRITNYDPEKNRVTIEMHASVLRYLHSHPEKLDWMASM